MRAEFFGDSYDIVKRFLISRIIDAGYSIVVNPMNNGADDYLNQYYSFIGADASLNNKNAIFFDPDTGIKAEDTPTHISYDTIFENCIRYKVVMIFDQGFTRNRNHKQAAIDNKNNLFRASGIHSMYYMSLSHACFCFCCRHKEDLDKVMNSILASGFPPSKLRMQN